LKSHYRTIAGGGAPPKLAEGGGAPPKLAEGGGAPPKLAANAEAGARETSKAAARAKRDNVFMGDSPFSARDAPDEINPIFIFTL
jgi:hypothetical protein